MIVHCQLGHGKYLKEGQLIEVYLNGSKVKMECGDYLSSQAKRRTQMWYIRPIECSEGDIITLDCKVGLRELGTDEDRTFTAVFRVSEACGDIEFKFPKVGYSSQFPLIKGKVERISLLTAKEKRLERIKAKLNGEENGKSDEFKSKED